VFRECDRAAGCREGCRSHAVERAFSPGLKAIDNALVTALVNGRNTFKDVEISGELQRIIERAEKSTLKKLMTRQPLVDRQREHQANERTFLAWLRTSIALISFGFALTRFGIFLRQLQVAVTQHQEWNHPLLNSENLGISLVIFGIIVIAIAAWRYNQVYWQIERGNYRPDRLMIWLTTAIVMILGIFSIPLLLLRDRVPISPSSPPSQQQSQKRPDR
jgi:putative membrane protein